MNALSLRCLVLACCSLGLLAGCTTSTGFRSASENDKFVEICTRDGEAVLVLLADDCSRSTAQTGKMPAYQGKFVTTDGEEIGWTCDTKNGRRGTVTIDAQIFELENGTWFQLSPTADGVKVAQFHADTKGLTTAAAQGTLMDELRTLADKHAPIAAFLAK